MNKVILIGRMTKDTELKYTPNQNAFLMNTIAVQRDYRNQNGEYDTDFINFVASGMTAELISKHFVKGDRIGLVGAWRTRTYQNQDGQNVYVNELNVREIEFLQDKKPEAQPQQPTQNQAPKQYQGQPNYNQGYNGYNQAPQRAAQPNQYQGSYQPSYQQGYQQPNQYQVPQQFNVEDDDLPF